MSIVPLFDTPAVYADAPALAEINALELTADASEAETSELRWRQAERVVELLDGGMTQQQVADAWHRADGSTYSHVHVSYVAKAWRLHLGEADRPRWNEAYHSPAVREATPASSTPNRRGRRPPIAASVGAAADALLKFSERIESILSDDRFDRGKNELAAPLRNQLVNAIEALQRLLAQLDPQEAEPCPES